MYGSLLSVLLMGMIPVWGLDGAAQPLSRELSVNPPASLLTQSPQMLSALETRLTASGVIIIDLGSGQKLFEREGDVARPMASLTKLMTALIIVENHELDEVVTVPSDIGDVFGTVAYLPARQRFTVGDLLSALLITSGNDAAVTLARYHSGSMEEFVSEMNERATMLGLKDTTYANATGLDAPSQVSSPRDLGWLTMYVMRYPAVNERMSSAEGQIRSLEGNTLSLYHTHTLLHAENSIVAGKTGTTDEAGQCLLSILDVGDRKYAAILLNSLDRYSDMQKILELLPKS